MEIKSSNLIHSVDTPLAPSLSNLLGDAQMSILVPNHSTLNRPGIPILLLPSSPIELKPGLNAVPFETMSIASPNSMLSSFPKAPQTKLSPEFHSSSTSLSSIVDPPDRTHEAIISMPSANYTGSLNSDNTHKVRRHRHARMPGGPPLICAVCGDAASRYA